MTRRPGYGPVQVSDGDDGMPPPRKPKVVDPDTANDPSYEGLRTDTVEPLVLRRDLALASSSGQRNRR
ncbi:hypothetical protein I0C86_19605 [Plantactinospora sp. S1510]|uniref:Uncharacterized protein n=1 Tax=Plantactinospora alkalitolerans TaxID=2789879 RepID=A0ABS0GY74_9ACTN|nr:hypothetical protein [Plantactinospora alkalitolerans]MBF9131149.1 hypothetical protein [Plantactinospora alkalitolerans]